MPSDGAVMGYADRYDPETDFDRWYTDATAEAILPWITPEARVLELGCATGLMTRVLAGAARSLVAVDREQSYLARAESKALPNVRFILGDITTLDLPGRFDHVVAANVVHEVRDINALFARFGELLEPHGRLHISLQNPQSIHRLVGEAAGMIGSLTAVSHLGQRYGTLRMLSARDLEVIGASVGFRCIARRGIMLKPLPNDLMSSLPEAILRGLVAVADQFPDHCAMNYLVYERAPGAAP